MYSRSCSPQSESPLPSGGNGTSKYVHQVSDCHVSRVGIGAEVPPDLRRSHPLPCLLSTSKRMSYMQARDIFAKIVPPTPEPSVSKVRCAATKPWSDGHSRVGNICRER